MLDVLKVFIWLELHDVLAVLVNVFIFQGMGSNLTKQACGDPRLIVMAARSAKRAQRFRTCSKLIPNV